MIYYNIIIINNNILFNKKRRFILDVFFAGVKILDVGCGGGILCEPLARMGAKVTGKGRDNNNKFIKTEV